MKNDLKITRELFKPGSVTFNNDIKFLVKPLAIFLAVAIVLVVSVQYGLGQISKYQGLVAASEQTRDILSKKVQILTKINVLIPEESDFISFALPHRNAVIYALSQVRALASQNSVVPGNIRSGGNFENKGVSKITITFDLDGPEDGVYAFLDAVTKTLPVMTVDKVRISSEAGEIHATVTLSAYTAELPKKIPSLTAAVTDLTGDEVELLNAISSYNPPTFFELEAQEPGFRVDPFN